MPTMTDWIQAGCAIATLFLAVIIFLQQMKLKTLTDVVGELTKQTKILASKYRLDFDLSEKERFPVFIFENKFISMNEPGKFHFALINIGQNAHDIKFYSNNPHRVEVSASRTSLTKLYRLDVFVNIQDHKPDFEIHFTFQTDRGSEVYKKPISCSNGNLFIYGAKKIGYANYDKII